LLQRCEIASSSDEKSTKSNADEADEEPPKPNKRKGRNQGKTKKDKDDKGDMDEEDTKPMKRPSKKKGDEYDGLFDDLMTTKDDDDKDNDPDNEAGEESKSKGKPRKTTHKKKEKTEPLLLILRFSFTFSKFCATQFCWPLVFIFWFQKKLTAKHWQLWKEKKSGSKTKKDNRSGGKTKHGTFPEEEDVAQDKMMRSRSFADLGSVEGVTGSSQEYNFDTTLIF